MLLLHAFFQIEPQQCLLQLVVGRELAIGAQVVVEIMVHPRTQWNSVLKGILVPQ